MSVLIAILKAIPALKSLGEMLERNIRRGTVEKRRKRKMGKVDAAIAAALVNDSKRVPVDEVGQDRGTDEETP